MLVYKCESNNFGKTSESNKGTSNLKIFNGIVKTALKRENKTNRLPESCQFDHKPWQSACESTRQPRV